METIRIRINAKQTSKGEWYFDITAETDDVGASADRLIKAVQATEKRFIEDHRTLVGENFRKLPGST